MKEGVDTVNLSKPFIFFIVYASQSETLTNNISLVSFNKF